MNGLFSECGWSFVRVDGDSMIIGHIIIGRFVPLEMQGSSTFVSISNDRPVFVF